MSFNEIDAALEEMKERQEVLKLVEFEDYHEIFAKLDSMSYTNRCKVFS